MPESHTEKILNLSPLTGIEKVIAEKVLNNQRISTKEGLYLYKHSDLAFVGLLASHMKERISGNKVFYNRNFHIEPTNLCIYNCKFCSYRRNKNEADAWEHTIEEIIDIVKKYRDNPVTEVHIVGGVHPDWDIQYYSEMLKRIHKINPGLHIKAFTAIELDYIFKKSGITIEEGLKILKKNGLGSIPGGGAEIFNRKIRNQVCKEKTSAERWLEIHETAHRCGISSNATILYGHIEQYEDRIDHMERLRKLQDTTGGFNTFIPLKYRKMNNPLHDAGEVSTLEDLKNYAVSRIFLDNFPHLKAYWPMIGKDTTQLSLSFGVDDIDGTIDDTTKIYSMAGVEDQVASMTSDQLIHLIEGAHKIPVERDTLYNEVAR